MDAVFIRHGSAEPAGTAGDAARRLTDAGRDEVAATARALRAMGVKVQRIQTSPLARAAETARILSEAHDGAELEVVEFLAPPADAAAVQRRLDALAGEDVQAVALVGHAPSLGRCIGRIIADADSAGLPLSKAGAACVRIPPPESSDSPHLRWLMRAEQLAMLARTE